VHEHVPIVPLIGGLADRIDELQREALVGPGDPRVISEALLGFVHNLGMFGAVVGSRLSAETARERVAGFVDVLWHGLAPRS
jgi:hypothetical protein